jgi:hypothetical protein
MFSLLTLVVEVDVRVSISDSGGSKPISMRYAANSGSEVILAAKKKCTNLKKSTQLGCIMSFKQKTTKSRSIPVG